jgi:hypothetical protein
MDSVQCLNRAIVIQNIVYRNLADKLLKSQNERIGAKLKLENTMKIQIKKLALVWAMVGICASGVAQPLLSTLGSTAGNDWNIGSGYFSIAEEFTTGSLSESIGSVSFYTGNLYGSGDPLTVSFYSNASGQPGSLVSDGSLSGPGSLSSHALITFNASALTLTANTTYWLVFDSVANYSVQVQNRQGGSLVTTSSQGWTLGNFGYKNEGSANAYGFTYTGIAEPLFSIASPAPEPSIMGLAGLGGILSLWFLSRRK